jgi:hypothetical protein
MTGMKRIKKLIAAFSVVYANPVERLQTTYNAIREKIKSDVSIEHLSIFDDLFADAIDLAKSKEQKTEAAS